MYAILGKIVEKFDKSFIIEANNIFYEIYTSNLQNIILGSQAKIFTKTFLREDEFITVGFKSFNEMLLFLGLVSISGIGIRIALNSMAVINAESYMSAIVNKDIKTLTSLPGISDNSAVLMITKLAKKFMKVNLFQNDDSTGVNDEIVQILLSLGYKLSKINRIRYKIPADLTLKDSLSFALKELKNE